MDTRPDISDGGFMEFFNNQEEEEKAIEKNPHLRAVELYKNCKDCKAFRTRGNEYVCSGGNRRSRRIKFKCRVKKILWDIE